MLQNKLFTFSELQTAGDMVTTNIELNASHSIFKGHFPSQPVLPGVCMMQMVKELVEAYINKETKLAKASDLKFLSFVVPEPNKVFRMELKVNNEADAVRVDARLLDNATILFKFKGTFVSK